MGFEALKKQVGTVAELIAWARKAQPRDAVIYHVGQLVTDRQRVIGLHDLAETVGLLQDTGFLVGSQAPMSLAAFTGRVYWAIRTGGGWMPKSVADQRIDATVFRALRAVRDRDAAMSATRTIRDSLALSETLAVDVLTRLYALRLIQEAPGGRGWQLTELGQRMLA